MKLKIEVDNRIDDLDKNQWDSFCDFFYMKSDVLKNIEGLKLIKKPFYIKIIEEDKIVGACVCYIQHGCIYSNLEESLYGKLTPLVKFAMGLNPSLLCYQPYSPFYEMFKIEKGENEKEIFELFEKEMERLSIIHNCKSHGFLAVSDEKLIEFTKNSNYEQLFSGYKIRVDMKEKSFDEYVQSIKRIKRKIVKKELRKVQESGYEIKHGIDNEDELSEILNVFDQNFLKYDNDGHKEEADEFIKAMMKNKKENRPIFVFAKKDGKIMAASMDFEDQKRIIGGRLGKIEGCDSNVFFSVSLYESIKYGTEKNKETFELGTGSYRYKINRGASIYNAYSIFKVNNKFKTKFLKPIFFILNKRNFKKHTRRLKE